MSSNAGVNRIIEDVRGVIDYVRREYEVNYAEAIGALRVVARELEDELLGEQTEDEGEEWKRVGG